MGFFSSAIRIAEKDLRTEFRRVYEILSSLTFSVSPILICSFVWGGGTTVNPNVGWKRIDPILSYIFKS